MVKRGERIFSKFRGELAKRGELKNSGGGGGFGPWMKLSDCLHFAVLCSFLIAGYISYSPAGSNSLPARELYHYRAALYR